MHRGHVQLAERLIKKHGLARVYFVPVKRSPFKTIAPVASAKDRLALLRLALAGNPKLKISKFELGRPAPSFTVDTVRHFRKKFPGAELFLIMGEDARRRFRQWKNWQEIEKDSKLIRLGRIGGISSSKIRSNISAGKNINKMVSPKVEAVLRRKNIYLS